jgi:hypothetical protein
MIRDKLAVPFAMEIITLMAWAIWVTRNDWISTTSTPRWRAVGGNSRKNSSCSFLELNHLWLRP